MWARAKIDQLSLILLVKLLYQPSKYQIRILDLCLQEFDFLRVLCPLHDRDGLDDGPGIDAESFVEDGELIEWPLLIGMVAVDLHLHS